MKKTLKGAGILVLMLALLVTCFVPATAAASTEDIGKEAYGYLKQLAEFAPRVTGTEGFEKTQAWLDAILKGSGMDYEVQDFQFTRGSTTYDSKNFIVTVPGKSEKTLIVGAHYDSVVGNGSQGVDDNGSSTALLLEHALSMKGKTPEFTTIYIFFGSEEVGLQGSKYYVDQMTEADIANTVAMVNMDSIYAGDYMYIYGGAKQSDGTVTDTWFFEYAWDLSQKLNLDIKNTIGYDSVYPGSTTGDWSDHAYFKRAGIPFIYFEATNWDLDPAEGAIQTEKFGAVMHTKNDNLEILDEAFPGRGLDHLNQYGILLNAIVMNLGADYSEFEQVLADFAALDPDTFTASSYSSVKDKLAEIAAEIPRGLLYSEQDIVDDAVKALKDAILELVEIPAPPTTEKPSETNKGTDTGSNPNTGDPMTIAYIGAAVLALGGTAIARKKKSK